MHSELYNLCRAKNMAYIFWEKLCSGYDFFMLQKMYFVLWCKSYFLELLLYVTFSLQVLYVTEKNLWSHLRKEIFETNPDRNV